MKAALILLAGLCCALAGAGPYKAAMHMHTSMSEGSSTVHSHADYRELLGDDILYITDHDAMIADEASAKDMTTFSFDARTLPAIRPFTPRARWSDKARAPM